MIAYAALLQEDGLTLREILTNIPHNAAAIVVYVLLAVLVGFIWYGSRNSSAPPSSGGSTDGEPAAKRDPQARTRDDR
jgi:hypothetical protein